MPSEALAHNSSVLGGHLLQEISWSGRSIREYRNGGLGYENVLTAEALQGLDFLPRSAFLGAVIKAAQGASAARYQLVEDAEHAEFTLLPGDKYLETSTGSSQRRITVQPDGLIDSPRCFTVVEAKRIRRGSFQPEQLAREFVLTIRGTEGKTPLLLLILGAEPPVPVQRQGRMSIEQAIGAHIESVLQRIGWHEYTKEALLNKVPNVVAWITWQKLSTVIESQLATLCPVEPSIRASITRLANSVTSSIARHS